MVAVAIIFPFWMLYFLNHNQSRLDSDMTFKDSYGQLYSCLITDRLSCLAYNWYFLVRRLSLAASCVLLRSYPLFQLTIAYLQSVIAILYLVRVRPFETPLLNNLEIFNEIATYLNCCCALILTNVLPIDDPALQYRVGWVVILIVACNILVNLFAIMSTSFKAVKMKLVLCCKRR